MLRYVVLSARERKSRREILLRRMMNLLLDPKVSGEARSIIINHAMILAKKYEGRPRSLAHLAIASLLAASRELGIEVNLRDLIMRAEELGHKGITPSLINRIAYNVGNNLSLKKHHREMVKRILYKLVSSLELPHDKRLKVLKEASRLCELAGLTGLPPSTRALLSALLALEAMGLTSKVNIRKTASAVGCSEITVYKAIRRARELLEKSHSKFCLQEE